MAIDPNKKSQADNPSSGQQRSGNSTSNNGIVTVNDDNNPTPEQRDAQIPNELDTERLRSERQSVQEGKRSE